ncbi:NAD(P)/FAD-dependent oxidoreductase [Cellulomonas algicola]|uniref:NADH dehydrogenase n=1 Tax=Cellulomonas algicola TaxID=2071633 RepID=A0A401UYF3_9CELL|nr:NAD(P)/FAD-dependent oxidoreductase [Cellulomonas algicola]GCD19731.1 NADH dehydrogenase [Cellulomonas algicola]
MSAAEVVDLPVVVLGGGLAGVACAHRLADADVPVVLVDRNDYHQFQPLLYQVATSQLPAEDVARPHRTVFRRHPAVQVRTIEAVAVDAGARAVTLADGQVLRGSALVLAAGAQPEFFGVPGAAEHAFPLYSVADAERLRRHLHDVVRTGADAPDGARHVVVVGGGPTGVETAGAVAELFAALAHTGRLAGPAKVTLVDRGSALLAPFAEASHAYAHEHLVRHGVDVRLGTGVAAVHADRVELTDGTVLPARTVVWGGGESAAPILAGAGVPTGRGGRVTVRPDLRVEGLHHVYAVGDAANVPDGDGDGTLPQLGSVAQQSGRTAADNLLRERAGEDPHPFRYRDKGIMAMIGRNAAVAEVGRKHHQVEGPVAFAAWLGVHAMLLSGAHSKTDAFLSWGWDYFDRDHAALVEMSSTPHRIAWGDDEADVPHIVVDGTPARSAAG